MVRSTRALNHPVQTSIPSVTCICPYCSWPSTIGLRPSDLRKIYPRIVRVTLFEVDISRECINCNKPYVLVISIPL